MKRKVYFVLISTIFVSLSIVRYNQINNRYPNPMIVQCAIGDTCTCFNAEIEVISGRFLSYTDLDEESILRTEVNSDMTVLEVQIRLTANEETQIPLNRMAAQNGLMCNNPMYIMMLELYNGTRIEMEKGEEKEVTLFYSFDQNAYYSKDWDRMKYQKWNIEIVDTYPYRFLMEIPL